MARIDPHLGCQPRPFWPTFCQKHRSDFHFSIDIAFPLLFSLAPKEHFALLKAALASTAQLWEPILLAYRWVHQAAHILENHQKQDGAGVRQQLEELLSTMQVEPEKVAVLGDAVEHFLKVTASYAPA